MVKFAMKFAVHVRFELQGQQQISGIFVTESPVVGKPAKNRPSLIGSYLGFVVLGRLCVFMGNTPYWEGGNPYGVIYDYP